MADYRSVLRSALVLGIFILVKSQEECQRGGCFPATGDLLVGRENRISATSTCGLKGREQYCIVSFLNQKEKCFYCDSTRAVSGGTSQAYKYSHLPKYMVTASPQDRLKGWWQAENGKQEVMIQVDLEAEFVFTHLIMTFKTFRPKAMYIERSWNYGKNWDVYRYFAYNCTKSFPKIPKGPQKNIDDVICVERYSKVEPSTKGEVVLKVLDPIIQQKEDPYSFKVQDLLKLTNLRVKFTELHTFGDDVLGGKNPEVNKKYYYSLYEMVVRGSCSCYGHAEHCIPAEGTPANVNMVHGKCNCTHFTTGRNCEKCMDGYHDEPWRPAYKGQLNVCKKCNCNGHTEKCHFDPAVYNATGGTSGGVCDDCQHNTAGRQCETCKPLYYRDPFKNIFDPDVCKPCDCDPAGSIGGGECETVTSGSSTSAIGRCLCKANAEGRRCDQCKDGFWNMLESNQDGCKSCECDSRGTVESNKCDQQSGTCRCLRYVKGRTCSKCSEGYWALGTTPEGCKPCDCDPGGSKNSTCDDVSGMCQCRQYLTGRKCDKVRPGYYVPNLDDKVREAEDYSRGSGSAISVSRRIYGKNENVEFTGDGYLQVQQGSVVEYDNINVPYSGRYSIVFRYDNNNRGDWDDVRITIRKESGARLGENHCAPFDATEQVLFSSLPGYKTTRVVDQTICLEKGSNYEFKIDFRSNNGQGNIQTFIDSLVLIPKVEDLAVFKGREGGQRKIIYDQYECQKYYLKPGDADNAPKECKDLQFSISSEMNNGALPCRCDPTGTVSSGSSETLTCNQAGGQCPCKPGVVGRRCDRCASGYFGFGPNGCTACDCSAIGSTSLFCHDTTGKCPCKLQLEGRKCDLCPVNHFGFPNCKPCACSGHSETCDVVTGKCVDCKHNTADFNCDKCAEGYYGDARKGTDNDCSRCQCPGGSSGNQFSNICTQQFDGTVVCNNCSEGYSGDQCERCTDGYYGNPLTAGGSCKKCECNGNIDPFASNKCNPDTGVCNACVNNAAGDHCEKCKVGFFGSAKNQTCKQCVCNVLGTDGSRGACDSVTGQCPCLKNVDGLACDKCGPGYYNLASGAGCIECNCDKEGSLEGSCNQIDGQCRCRVGFGGRNCSECEDFSWGDPKSPNGCKPCGCNPIGSKSAQCNRMTGLCTCKENIIGDKCDMCAPRTAGIMPKCENCHTCNDQWEDIVSALEKNITFLIKLRGNFTFNASEIELYTKEIQNLKDNLKMIEDGMDNRQVKAGDVDELRRKVGDLRKELAKLDAEADKYVVVVKDTERRNKNANDELDNLDIRYYKLNLEARNFKNNVTKMIESNIGGALNSTRESQRRSREAQKSVNDSEEKLKQSKKFRKKIKKEIIMGDPDFKELDKENNELVDQLTKRIDDLEKELKELNKMLCGGSDGCGGCTASGCETCGGSGNCTGAKNMAEKALKKANDAKEKLMKKKADAEVILKDVSEAEKAVNASKKAANDAEASSKLAKKIGEEALANITALIKDIREFLKGDFKHPILSTNLALDTLTKNISLTPEQVKDLAEQIKKAVGDLKGVPEILKESRKDYLTAINLRDQALRTRDYALAIMNKTERILGMLSKANELQNSTAQTISIARANIDELLKLIEQIKEKQDNIGKSLSQAESDVNDVEKRRDEVKSIFEENRKNLQEAEGEAAKSEDLAKQVNETSAKLNAKYDTVKEKLKEKQDYVKDIQKRLKTLADGAIDLFKSALVKLDLIDELKKKFNRNEIRVQDLIDELRRLEIKSEFSRNKIQELSQCHSECNPLATGDICTRQLADLEQQEKNALDAHNNMVKSSASTR